MFCHFFHIVIFVIIVIFHPQYINSWYLLLVPLVSATPLKVLYRLLWNFACVFFMVWGCDLDIIVRLFFHFFPHCELSRFPPSIYRQWVPPEHNFSYNFILIFLELCTGFIHSLKMCICFSYNPCRIFVTFLFVFNFVIYWPQMYRQWVPYDCNFSYNFKLFFFFCFVFFVFCCCFFFFFF